MKFNLKALIYLFLSLLIVAPSVSEAAVKKAKRHVVSHSKKKFSKKRYTKRYSKKRSGKRYRKSRRRTVESNFFHVPANYAVYGIDVSKYQGQIDWANLAAPSTHNFSVNFAFIKATEGGDRKDPRFEQNWTNAGANNVKRGAYHFYRPGTDPYVQAQNFISSVRLSSGDLPPVIDVEKRGIVSEETFQQNLKTFATLLENAYGIKPIIYTGYRFFHKHLSTNLFDGYHFWVAHYGKKDLDFRNNWKFWQFTCKARVMGIRPKVDLNVFNGTMAELHALCVK